MRLRTADEAIRELRAELHSARCADKDHSDKRLFYDGQRLDLDMWLIGIPCKRTTWGNDPERDLPRRAKCAK